MARQPRLHYAGERVVVRVEASGYADTLQIAHITPTQTTLLGTRLLTAGVTSPKQPFELLADTFDIRLASVRRDDFSPSNRQVNEGRPYP